MINMPKTLIDKVDNMQKQMDNIYKKKRDGNSKKDQPKRNARDKNK